MVLIFDNIRNIDNPAIIGYPAIIDNIANIDKNK